MLTPIVITESYLLSPKANRTNLCFNLGDNKAVPIVHWSTNDLKNLLERFYGRGVGSPLRKGKLVGVSREVWIKEIKQELKLRG